MKQGSKGQSLTREVGPLSFRATVVPGSLNVEKRTVDVAYDDGAVAKEAIVGAIEGQGYEVA